MSIFCSFIFLHSITKKTVRVPLIHKSLKIALFSLKIQFSFISLHKFSTSSNLCQKLLSHVKYNVKMLLKSSTTHFQPIASGFCWTHMNMREKRKCYWCMYSLRFHKRIFCFPKAINNSIAICIYIRTYINSTMTMTSCWIFGQFLYPQHSTSY